jgi:hypothetical protein
MSDEAAGRDWDGLTLRKGSVGGIEWRVAEGGLPWVICGYVNLPREHPWRTAADGTDLLTGVQSYDGLPAEASEDTPSELTYTDAAGWIGFDTGHHSDHWSRDALAEAGITIPPELEDMARWFVDGVSIATGLPLASTNMPWDFKTEWSIGLLEDVTRRWAESAAAAFLLPIVLADLDRTTRGETE